MASFTIGTEYNVWESKGLAPDRAGRLAISENNHEQGTLHPEMQLTYLGKKFDEEMKGVHAFRLPDGRVVKGHPNHFNPETVYNKGKLATRQKAGVTPPTPQTVAERKAIAEARVKELMATIQELDEVQDAEEDALDECPEDLLSESLLAIGE